VVDGDCDFGAAKAVRDRIALLVRWQLSISHTKLCQSKYPARPGVPTRNSERAVMIYLRLLIRRSRKLHDRRSPYSAPLAQLDRENPGRSPNRDRRPPSPSQHPQTLRSQPSQTSTLGPTFLDMAVARLARLALRSCPRETRNSRRLASQRFPILLDLEKPARASRETFDSQGRP
jgi:hypothetical protein